MNILTLVECHAMLMQVLRNQQTIMDRLKSADSTSADLQELRARMKETITIIAKGEK